MDNKAQQKWTAPKKLDTIFAASIGLLSAGSDAIGGFELAGAYKILAKLGLKDGVK